MNELITEGKELLKNVSLGGGGGGGAAASAAAAPAASEAPKKEEKKVEEVRHCMGGERRWGCGVGAGEVVTHAYRSMPA